MTILLKRDSVYNRLRNSILSGELAAGEKLPAGMRLARQYDVSYMTLRAALSHLKTDGFIQQIHGKGTFVTYDPHHAMVRTVGVVMPELGAPLTPEKSPMQYLAFTGMMSAAEQNDIEMVTMLRGRRHFADGICDNMGIDGVIVLYPKAHDMGMLQDLNNACVPLLLVNLLDPEVNVEFNFVNCDFYGAGAGAVRYLHRKGCRRITLVTTYGLRHDFHPYSLLEGCRSEWSKLNLPSLVVHAESGSLHIRKEIEKSLIHHVAELLTADAVITSNSMEALAIESLLREHGRRIPGDTALISCNDDAELKERGITALRMPCHELGYEAIVRMKGLTPALTVAPRNWLVPMEMICRDSA